MSKPYHFNHQLGRPTYSKRESFLSAVVALGLVMQLLTPLWLVAPTRTAVAQEAQPIANLAAVAEPAMPSPNP